MVLILGIYVRKLTHVHIYARCFKSLHLYCLILFCLSSLLYTVCINALNI